MASKRGGARPNSGGQRFGAGRPRSAVRLVLLATRVPAEQFSWLTELAEAAGTSVGAAARMVIGMAWAKRRE